MAMIERWGTQPTREVPDGQWRNVVGSLRPALLLQHAFSETLLSSTGSTFRMLLADDHCS